jgi:HEAT repeat protein
MYSLIQRRAKRCIMILREFATPTGNIDQSRLVLGPMRFPVMGPDGQVQLQERKFSFEKTKKVIEALRILGVDIGFRHYIRTDEVNQEGPHALFSTPTGGRSEALTIAPKESPLNLFLQTQQKPGEDEKVAREAAKKALLQLIREETGLSLPAGVLIKLKGRGPKRDQTPQRQSLLSQRYYERQHSLQGFTSVDENDALLPFLIEQEQDVVGMDGHGESYQYIPSRRLLAVIPIRSIQNRQTREILAQPQDWNEQLYLELFIEAGGYCLEDLMTAQKQGADLVSYAEAVLETYGFTKSDDPSMEARRKQISAFLIQKAWYDAQVEARYFTIGANRTMQNKTLGGDQDFDDCKRKEPPRVDVSFLEYFFQKIDRLKRAGFITQETLVASLHTVMDNLTTITSTINDQSSVPHSDKEVRRNRDHYSEFFSSIARACGEIGGKEGSTLLEKILEQDLGNNRSEVLRSIAQVCGAIGGAEGTTLLSKILEEQDLGSDRSWVLRSIAQACGTIGGAEGSTLLNKILEQQDLGSGRSWVFSSIAQVCGEIGGAEGSTLLEKILEEQDLGNNRSWVFSSIAQACGEIGGAEGSTLLNKILGQQDLGSGRSGVFSSIAQVCGTIGGAEGSTLLNKILEQQDLGDNRSWVFSSIAQACGEIGGAEGTTLLSKILEQQDLGDNRSGVFSSIAQVCGTIGGAEGTTLLSKILEQQDLGSDRSWVFSSIAQACGEIGGAEGSTLLNKILGQQDLGSGRSGVFSST